MTCIVQFVSLNTKYLLTKPSINTLPNAHFFPRTITYPQIPLFKKNYFTISKTEKMINTVNSIKFILFIVVAFLFIVTSTSAMRPLSDYNGIGNTRDAYDIVYVKERSTMAYWLERLASGPSGGGGH